jgi:hypothetical protein
MSVDDAKALARRLRDELVTTGDPARADELLAPEFRDDGPPSLGPEPADREAFKGLHAADHQGFPDIEVVRVVGGWCLTAQRRASRAVRFEPG